MSRGLCSMTKNQRAVVATAAAAAEAETAAAKTSAFFSCEDNASSDISQSVHWNCMVLIALATNTTMILPKYML